METFVLTMWARRGKRGGADLVLQCLAFDGSSGKDRPTQTWRLPYAGPAAREEKIKVVLRVAERRGMLINAAWASAPRAFDGSAREFANFAFERNHAIGELKLSDNSEAMRLALAFALAGRCNTVGRMHAVTDGLTNLPAEVVLYWFTLCFYGQRRKAGKAALFTLLTTKG